MNQPLNQPVLSARARLGECPLWDAKRQQLFWVDVYNYRVHQFDPATGHNRFFELDAPVSAIVLAQNGKLLMALGDRIALLDPESGETTDLHRVQFPYPNTRFNDGKCDARGRFWIGSVSQERGQAELYRYDPDGSLHVMETGLTISNGLGWSPDGSTFYLTDSAPHLIYAYDFDLEAGTIRNRRVFADLSREAVEPDGLAIDVEGNLWSALWNGWSVVCFSPDGEELQRLKLPVQRPTSVAFGGSNGMELYITSASVGLSQKEIQQGFYAGDVFRCAMETSGREIYSFPQG